jgi:hypothetical protein
MRALVKTGLVIVCLPLLTAADIYRWVDENGVVNYTQQKPRGVDAELVSGVRGPSQTTPKAPTPGGNPSDTSPELDERQQRLLEDLQAAEAARRNEIARVREENCSRARGVLDRLTSKSRIRVRGDDGEVHILNEEERQERISEAQRGVATNCDSAEA